MKSVIWTPAEEEMLFGLTGDMPWTVVCRIYNQWAAANGFAPRTSRALRRRAHINGYVTRSMGQWLDVPTVASLLGFCEETIRRWARCQIIESFRQGKKIYISRKSLRKFAKKSPEYFGKCKRDNLFMLLEDDALARSLSVADERKNHGRAAKVLCVETGRIYPSYRAAANAMWVTRQALTHAIIKGHRSAGYHWKKVA